MDNTKPGHGFAERYYIQSTNPALGPLCVGIDPDPNTVAKFFGEDNLENTRKFCENILTAAQSKACVIKVQKKFFEAKGWKGVQLFSEIVQEAKRMGFLVINDCKITDIGSSAMGAIKGNLACEEAPADAITIGYEFGLGEDGNAPLIKYAFERSCSVFMMLKPSNPSGMQIAEMKTQSSMNFSESLAWKLMSFNLNYRANHANINWGPLSGVVGATAPNVKELIMRYCQSSTEMARPEPILVPGFGRQGGDFDKLDVGFSQVRQAIIPSVSGDLSKNGITVEKVTEEISKWQEKARTYRDTVVERY